ncbi:ATP-binding cassette domain-containing protein [Acetobacterium paludosum]|uniref:ATP-binding cassette domain-containing protein n=1 Tax=Acetobacterium paludosum TaxID=52693 RepID=A0A923I2Z5_9FIRM|nr:ABC transporter ATP-binding protein [Acetobacterium paludosum]MBC3888135.1 ATP-binding cassette domain-containing protein [Acetobacterium paludosum]
MSLLSLQNVSFGYQDNQPIFENISFDVKPGEVFCIIGPNGCGKTTLIDSILGINQPQSGRIMVADNDLHKMKPKEFAKNIAYVPQSHTKTFPYTVLDIVVMGRTYATKMFSAPNTAERHRAIESLEQVGLKGFENRLYTELSGGELQLVLIARALAQESHIMIMDEPTAHLDFRHELMVMEIITWLVKEKGLTIIMATHFLNQAFYLENAGVEIRVALMNQGTFKAIGTPTEVLTKNNLKDVFKIFSSIGMTDEEGINQKFIVPLKNIR